MLRQNMNQHSMRTVLANTLTSFVLADTLHASCWPTTNMKRRCGLLVLSLSRQARPSSVSENALLCSLRTKLGWCASTESSHRPSSGRRYSCCRGSEACVQLNARFLGEKGLGMLVS
eukprot:4321569-Pleurochrysis_carterae.AAC.3